jgi:hypothetical protein
MGAMALTAFGVGFWAFLAIASVAGIVGDYKKRQIELEPLRAAIERGAQLDPAVVEKLMSREARPHSMNPIDLEIGGIITATSGIGVGIASFFVSPWMPVAHYPLLALGIVAVFVGGGLLLAARAVKRSVRAAIE